eukprot:CAMPEP_0182885074 /NCGR_PEP_ID=MMETSP0034_2-20130328/19389_1 /TAXON_ID=156128 /ORGANISM="Nephroselmis pyriformis, Strain CCMP717" /LENGTH=400 /DNA_ID=CAMNT_0025018321 /DNA_START=67 /DNA_END=1266 /DNA_ORIENTATION=-
MRVQLSLLVVVAALVDVRVLGKDRAKYDHHPLAGATKYKRANKTPEDRTSRRSRGSSPGNSLLIFSDTRPLPPYKTNLTLESATFNQVTSVLALDYALSHGDDFEYHHLIGSGGCTLDPQYACYHPTLKTKHSSWCKLLSTSIVLRSRLAKYGDDAGKKSYVVTMDSDMAFNRGAESIAAHVESDILCKTIPRSPKTDDVVEIRLINEGFNYTMKPHDSECKGMDGKCAEKKKKISIFTPVDPNGGFLQAGLMTYRREAAAMSLLADWWAEDHFGFPWEQGPLNTKLWPRHLEEIAALGCGEQYFNNPMFIGGDEVHRWHPLPGRDVPEKFLEGNWWVAHLTHFGEKGHPGARSRYFKSLARRSGIDDERFRELYKQLLSDHTHSHSVEDMTAESMRLHA